MCFLRGRCRVGREPVSSVVWETVSSGLVKIRGHRRLGRNQHGPAPLPHTLSINRTSSLHVTSSWDALSQPGSQTARVHGPPPSPPPMKCEPVLV